MSNVDLKIAIINYGMGNLQSVFNALIYIGDCTPVITDNPDIIKNSDGLILPGVGAFEDAMKQLEIRNLNNILNEEVIINKKPILGICLGMQLLFQGSEENGHHKGLGWLEGYVKKFKISPKLRIPHIGWNDLSYTKEDTLFNNINNDKNFYFVHSYYVETDEKNVIALSNYGIDFVAAVKKRNIFGTQFHPEKSHINGLTFLKNYYKIIKEF